MSIDSLNMLDHYTSEEIAGFYSKNNEEWPQKFKDIVNVHLANELLDSWLSSHDDEEYEDRVLNMIEDYGWMENK